MNLRLAMLRKINNFRQQCAQADNQNIFFSSCIPENFEFREA